MKPIRKYLRSLTSLAGEQEIEHHAYRGLTEEQINSLKARGAHVYRGKVRDVVQKGDQILVVHSDRLTAFDRMIGMVPYKGTILTAISDDWLRNANNVAPTHFRERPHERMLLCEKAEPFKVEIIVRGYLAGSMMRAYANGERNFCGHRLPDGLTPYGGLPQPLITPTTKAKAFEHDIPTTAKELVSRGVCSKKEWDAISVMALELFEFGRKRYADCGWILVDTKYEFGRTKNGHVIVIDEIHTPDSSRLWVAKTYTERLASGEAPDMLDKEIVRRFLLSQGFSGDGEVPSVPLDQLVSLAEVYLKVAETLTGQNILTEGPGQRVDVEGF